MKQWTKALAGAVGLLMPATVSAQVYDEVPLGIGLAAGGHSGYWAGFGVGLAQPAPVLPSAAEPAAWEFSLGYGDDYGSAETYGHLYHSGPLAHPGYPGAFCYGRFWHDPYWYDPWIGCRGRHFGFGPPWHFGRLYAADLFWGPFFHWGWGSRRHWRGHGFRGWGFGFGFGYWDFPRRGWYSSYRHPFRVYPGVGYVTRGGYVKGRDRVVRRSPLFGPRFKEDPRVYVSDNGPERPVSKAVPRNRLGEVQPGVRRTTATRENNRAKARPRTPSGSEASRRTPTARPTTPVRRTPAARPVTPARRTPAVRPTTPTRRTPQVQRTPVTRRTPAARPTTPTRRTPSVRPNTPTRRTPQVQRTPVTRRTPAVRPTTPTRRTPQARPTTKRPAPKARPTVKRPQPKPKATPRSSSSRRPPPKRSAPPVRRRGK